MFWMGDKWTDYICGYGIMVVDKRGSNKNQELFTISNFLSHYSYNYITWIRVWVAHLDLFNSYVCIELNQVDQLQRYYDK